MFTAWLEQNIRHQWNEKILGPCIDLKIEAIYQNNQFQPSDLISPVTLIIANIAAASTTLSRTGTANSANLKTIKTALDVAASRKFAQILEQSSTFQYIAASEAKDEFGDTVDDPVSRLQKNSLSNYGIAVDVVDGTTLAAKGLNGAYTISAAAYGLKSFPDYQAYTAGGPAKVLDEFDFFTAPEIAVDKFIDGLCEYYSLPPEQLQIVTHSRDKGCVHDTLIHRMHRRGVNVRIPDPVIVEPPYTLGMALHMPSAPHAMIGVFGLPEIVINTLLLSTLKTDCELRFRIGSNSLLENHNCPELSHTFDFKPEELEDLKRLGLETSKTYDSANLADDLNGACFAATAITDDPILNLRGVSQNGPHLITETLFSGYNGNLVKITARTGLPSDSIK